MRRYGAIALLLLCVSPVGAQVSVTTLTVAHCETPIPAGVKASYVWYADPGLVVTPSATGNEATLSGPLGTYDGVVVAAFGGEKVASAFTVTLGNLPAPVPPTPATLRELVTDEQAAVLASRFRALAAQVGKIQDADHFWKVFTDIIPIDGNVKLEAALRVRLAGPVEKKVGLSVELLAIADEFDGAPIVTPSPTVKVTAVVYIYERDGAAAIPNEVRVALSKLNLERGIRATTHEDGTTDSDGDIPDQYKVALAAAKQAGLPAAVSLAGDKVISVLPNPRTEQQIWSLAP